MKMSAPHNAVVVPTEQFWDAGSVVRTQNHERPYLHWYERHVLDVAAREITDRFGEVKRVHVVGCGAGREVPAVREAFPAAQIIASDFAPSMIEACRANLERWGCTAGIELRCCSAGSLVPDEGPAELVITFASMLTYVTPEAERRRTLAALGSLLRPGGLLIGVVHHRWGRPSKSGYFLLQQVACSLRLTSNGAGDRVGGFAGLRLSLHYFTAGELRGLLTDAGLRPLEILSLASLGRRSGRRYRSVAGYNNLVFTAAAS
jgi:SAM-dependent methyltransferase